MKKWQKTTLIIISGYISYYTSYILFKLLALNEQTIVVISTLIGLFPLILYIFVIRKMIKKENEEVSKSSIKIQELNKLNEKYHFKRITKKKHNIIDREYSRKSLERVTGSSIIKYHIENNIDLIRTDIENAIYNIDLLEEYTKEVDKIINYKSENKTNYSLKKFQKIENRVLNDSIHKIKARSLL